MGLAFIPFYITTLGVDAWGLVGFMAMLQSWFLLLDMGLTPALSREMARFTGGKETAYSIRTTLRTLEIIYSAIAVLVSLLVWFSADWMSENWLKTNQLPISTVQHALAIMGLVVAARMCEQVYRGAIQGLQHQVWLNGCLAILATLRWAGVIPVLLLVDSNIQNFFLWQGLISLFSVAVLARYTYIVLPSCDHPIYFDLKSLNNIKGFAGGIASTTLLALMLTQVDKLLLSKLVSLDEFGYYIVATSVASSLGFLVAPIASAVLPRMTECLSRSDKVSVLMTYHSASQWLAVALIPVSLVIAAFSKPLIFAWMGDMDVAEKTAPLLTLLALGNMFNGFMHIPYATQLAYGWTSLAVRINVIAVCLFIPAILWCVPQYGASAAAWAWLLLNVGYVLFSVHFMHKKIMNHEKWKWYQNAIVRPLFAATIFIVIIRSFLTLPEDRLQISIILSAIGLVTLAIVMAVVPSSKNYIFQKFVRP